ncbi:MAG: redoxin domain-containing protein [Chloroflexota bacterium]|nr:redoxin domain-containing protein [Chloroflexota bacterium]
MRQLAAYQEQKADLEKMGCSILIASVDTEEQARQVAQTQGLTYLVAYGCTRADAEAIGAWWGNHPPDGEHMQPAEFLLGRGGTVLGSMYASGAVGRMSVEEVIHSIESRERYRLRREQEQQRQEGRP